jgi:hypothetical protein
MVWPAALTTNADIISYVFEQGITRMLEGANTYAEVHNAVAEELRNWVESDGGINDADNITNTSIYVPAAANYFASKILANRDADLSLQYFKAYRRLRREARPKLNAEIASGGKIARVVLINQGRTQYTARRSGAIFPEFRESP